MIRSLFLVILYIFFSLGLFAENDGSDRFFDDGYTFFIHQEFDKALTGFDLFIREEKMSASPRKDKIAMMHRYRAYCYKSLMLYPLALKEFQDAREIYMQMNDAAKIAMCLESQASIFGLQGKVGQATSFFGEALKYYNSIQWNSAIQRISLELAYLFFRTQEYDSAREHLLSALKIRDEAEIVFENTYVEADIFYLLGVMAMHDGSFSSSEKWLQMADSIGEYYAASLAGKKALLADIKIALADLYRLIGNYRKSEIYLDKAFILTSRPSLNYLEPNVWLGKARWYESQGNYPASENIHQKVLVMPPGADGTPPYIGRRVYGDMLKEMVRYYVERFAVTSQFDYLLKKAELLEKLILQTGSYESEFSLFSDFILQSEEETPYYNQLIETVTDIYLMTTDTAWISRAFYFSELGYMQMVNSNLEQSLQLKLPDQYKDDLALLAALKGRINQTLQLVDSEGADAVSGKESLIGLMDEKEKLSSKLGVARLTHPDAAGIFNENLLDNLRSQLGEDELYLKYFDAGKKIVLFIVSPDKVFVETLEVTDALKTAIKTYCHFIQTGDPSLVDLTGLHDFCSSGFLLYQLLFDSIKDFMHGKVLIIETNGILDGIPFDALLTRDVKPASVAFSTLPYMIREYNMMCSHSAGFYLGSKVRNNNRLKLTYAGFAPFAQYSKRGALLPGSGREIGAGKKILGGKTFYGDEVTRNTLFQMSARTKILHLASHARQNLLYPQLSEIILNQQNAGDSTTDNLYFYDILSNSWAQQLVLIGACGSSNGYYLPNYGTISLANAFLASGARSVIAADWKVDDQASGRLLTGFFEQIRRGSDFYVALRNSKLAFIENSNEFFAHPHFWAVYSYIGGRQQLLPEKGINFVVVMAILTVIVLLGYFGIKRLYP